MVKIDSILKKYVHILYLPFSGDIREDYGIHRVEGTFWILDQSKEKIHFCFKLII